MRNMLILASGLILFLGCGTDQNSTSVKIKTEQADLNPIEKTIYSDTVVNFTNVGDFEFNGPTISDTNIVINGISYRLHLECELLKNQRIKTVDKFGADGKLHISTYIGYQARYRFALFQGEKKVFDRTLKKEDFKNSIYSLVVESDAYLPELVTYNEAFKSLVFQVPFYIDGSCSATQALLVMDLAGDVKIVDYLSMPSGSSANYDVQFSTNKKHILSSSTIYHANGKQIDLATKPTNQMGAEVFEDCVFAVYEPDERKHPKNAYLLDFEGKTLLNFPYEGWTGALGYHFPLKKVHGSHYFIDEENKRLIKVKKGKTWSYQFLPFSSMREFDGEIRSGEIPFLIQTEIHAYQFFLDARTNKFRKITPNEFY